MPQTNRTVKGVLGGFLGLIGLSAVAGILVTATVTPAIAVAGMAGSQALGVFEEIPEDIDIATPMEPSAIYVTGLDGNPVKLATFYEQVRTPVTFEQVNPVVYDALLSSEDKGFYEHGGINIAATAKALLENLTGASERGASTISQQYVKNVLIQNCEQQISPTSETYAEEAQKCWLEASNPEGSEGVKRKLQELRYAVQIEKEYSKQDILLGYLNVAPFGGTIYGIEAAANYYFSTSAANLSVAQAATLIGVVQNPAAFRFDQPTGSSFNTKDQVWENSEADGYILTKNRRDYVLGEMLDNGKITQAQYDEAVATPIAATITQPTQGCSAAGTNAYFCQYVKTILLSDPAFGETAEDRLALLRRGGLEVYTSLDLRVQNPATEVLRATVPSSDGNYLGSTVVTREVKTGRILAMAQNTDFTEVDAGDDQSKTSLVFATDKDHGGSNGFQVGSTYKLFTLLKWLEEGRSINESLSGVNATRTFDLCNDQTATLDTATVGNDGGGAGRTATVADFTRTSLNSGYFAMAEQLDICGINAVATKLGVTLGNGESTTAENVPYDVLGSKNISPLAMAGAYSTVANNGTYCTPRAIDRIVNQDGTEHALPESTCTDVLSEEVAATAAYTLKGVMTNGTGTAANPYDGIQVIGKTGTHQKTSTMMIESTTNTTTAVWVGRWSGHPGENAPRDMSYAQRQYRFTIAKATQTAANAIYGGDAFPDPDRNLTRVVYADLPNVVGRSISEAESILQAAGFRVAVGEAVDGTQGTGTIAAMSPGAGRAPGGSLITIHPSNGQGVQMPNVVGLSPGQAQSALESAGFNSIALDATCQVPGGGDDEDDDDNAQDRTVASSSPESGATTNRSATVTLVCS